MHQKAFVVASELNENADMAVKKLCIVTLKNICLQIWAELLEA